MSDPSESTQANPHPVSQHRTPREIDADEAGPIGKPDLDVIAKEASDTGAERNTPPAKDLPRAVSRKPRRRR
ncbi:MAG TPA: hypothetical protein VF836_02570 [Gemmatimonadaceae bacterium]